MRICRSRFYVLGSRFVFKFGSAFAVLRSPFAVRRSGFDSGFG